MFCSVDLTVVIVSAAKQCQGPNLLSKRVSSIESRSVCVGISAPKGTLDYRSGIIFRHKNFL